MQTTRRFGASSGADTAPIVELLPDEADSKLYPSGAALSGHQKSVPPQTAPELPVFPALFPQWPAYPADKTTGRDEELGPAPAVSQLAATISPVPQAPARAERFAAPTQEAAVNGSAPEAATATAARQELAALQEVLFDLALAVTRRKGELADLEGRMADLEALTEAATRLEARLAAKHAELAVLEQQRTGVVAETEKVQEELDRLTLREKELKKKMAGLEAGVDRLQSTHGALEERIGARTLDLERLELQKSRQIEAEAALTHRMEGHHAELARLAEQEELALAALSRVRNSLCDTQLQHELLNRQVESDRTRFDGQAGRHGTLTAELEALEAAVAEKSGLLADLGQQADVLKTERARLEAENRGLQDAAGSRCQALERSANEETARLEDARRDLVAARSRQEELAPALEEAEAKLAKLRKTGEEMETGMAEKSARLELLEDELRQTADRLAGLQATAANEERRLADDRRQLEDAITANTRTIEETRNTLRFDPWQQDLSNRHSIALNELEATQSEVASLRAEAFELQQIIDQRQAQKEALLEEILRAPHPAVPPSYQKEGTPAPAEQGLKDPALEQVISDLMRLVEATDTAHSHLAKGQSIEATNGQFTLLRGAVTATLANLGVQEFVLAPGTPVDSSLRRRIQVVKHLEGGAKPWIQSLLSPGFMTTDANGQTTLLRKPEVIVSSESLPG